MNKQNDSLLNVGQGAITETLRILTNLGVTPERLARVRSDPAFAKKIAEVFLGGIKKTQPLHWDKKVKAKYSYPKEYTGPRPIQDQIRDLAKIFNVNSKDALTFAKTLPVFPKDAVAEGYFAIINPEYLSSIYSVSVQRMLDEVKKLYPSFHNYREGQIDEKHIRLAQLTKDAYLKLVQEQKGPIWIIPANLGALHAGEAPILSLEILLENEFPLDVIAGCSIILTHTTRLVRWEELDMFLPGTEFSYDADGVFSKVAYLYFDDVRVGFDASGAGCRGDSFGVASGFPPQ